MSKKDRSPPDPSEDFGERQKTSFFKGPFLHYESLVWLTYGTFTILAIVDRFVWNVWPRETYSIGQGTAGSDFTDGLKDGPWTVQLYDVMARVSGRYTILALNLLLFTMMKSLMSWLAESWIAKHVIDFSDAVEGNRRLHKWNGIGIVVMTLVHVWSILFPCIVHGWRANVVLGNFEWILSERGPDGFKDVDLENKTMGLQGDDVFRIVEMTLLLAILLPLSVRWLSTRWHLGIHVHNVINVLYFIDIVRRHTHPHSWILNTPLFFAWIADSIIGEYWRRTRPKMYRLHLSADYMVLFSNENRRLNTVGPKYYLRLANSSLLERAHVFTGFQNWRNLDLADGKEWTSAILIRVYHNKRRPVLGRKDKVSHTQRVAEASNLDIYKWGPFLGSMSEAVYRSLQGTRPVTLVAGGSAAGYLIDAIQKHESGDRAVLTCLYTARDPALFQWVIEVFSQMMEMKKSNNVKLFVALTYGTDHDVNTADMVESKQRELQDCDENSASSMDSGRKSCIAVQYGRLNFEKLVPKGNIVYFQGAGGLQNAVSKACKHKKCRFVAGPAYDNDTKKKRFLLRGIRMNCLHKHEEIV